MPHGLQKLLAVLLIGLMGLSPVWASSMADMSDHDSNHCMEQMAQSNHSSDHDSGQCENNALCGMAHCATQLMNAVPLSVFKTSLTTSAIKYPGGDDHPNSITPSALYRPPQA
ncbi:MAG: hypothetical protein OEY52_05425 [Gammaproteobacteria bacterium]|nr:hypothetical protein [Gammaproteobacteria bacterium]